jgi:ABC-type glycerol-3-phosphate transport system permease component
MAYRLKLNNEGNIYEDPFWRRIMMVEENSPYNKQDSGSSQEGKIRGAMHSQGGPYPPPQPPPTTPPTQPYPYYPPQPPPRPMYSWEMFPYAARGLMKRKENKKPLFSIIGTFLLVIAIMAFLISGMFIYYGSSEELEFGGTTILTGNVKDQDGTNLTGAEISIIGTDLSSQTDGNGNYRINDAPNGIWKVRVSRNGYTEKVHKVLIQSGFSETIDFQMEEGDGQSEINDLWFFFSLAIIVTVLSCFTAVGAYYVFSQKRFSVALVGAVLGIFSMGISAVFFFITIVFLMSAAGLFLSILTLIMIITNRKSFKQPQTATAEPQDRKSV